MSGSKVLLTFLPKFVFFSLLQELVNKLKEWARGCYLMSGKLPGRAQLIADLPGVRAECCRTRAAIREQRQRVSRQLACIVGAQISDEAAGPLVFSVRSFGAVFFLFFRIRFE